MCMFKSLWETSEGHGICLGMSIKDLQELTSELSFGGWEDRRVFKRYLEKKASDDS